MGLWKVDLWKAKQASHALEALMYFFCWHPPKTIDFKDAAGTLYLKEYISFFSIQCCFPVFTLLGKLPSVKCKMDYLIIKIFQVYERVWDQ